MSWPKYQAKMDRMDRMEGIYNEERSKIKTGDPIFFSGKGFVSEIIKAATDSDISHIGMAVRGPLDIILCAESISRNDGKRGVQVNLLSDRVRDYNGGVFTKGLNMSRDEEFYRLLEAGFSFMRGRPYEKSILQLALSVCKEPVGGENFSSVFCSEFVAYFWKLWKLLPADNPADSYTPAELCNVEPLNRSFGPKRILKTS